MKVNFDKNSNWDFKLGLEVSIYYKEVNINLLFWELSFDWYKW